MKIKDRAKPKLPPVDPGTYTAVCVGVIDLGEQYSDMFKSYANKVQFVFELCGVTIEVDGKPEPRQLSREFTMSSSKKAGIRAFLSSWNGKEYSDEAFPEVDVMEQLGKHCFIQVVLNETGESAKIQTIMAPPPGIPLAPPSSAMIAWDMDKWDDKQFEALPGWVQEKIKKSTQYQKDHTPTTTVDVQTKDVCPI